MTLADIRTLCASHNLAVLGAFHPTPDDLAPAGSQTLVLLGPLEPGFWDAFTSSPEWMDDLGDPMDRWSARVISRLAEALGAEPLFPFGGAPFHPFFRWALASGQAWQSPVSLLVHAQAGLMVSYRGALAFQDALDLPSIHDPILAPAQLRPCDDCADKPCLTACPSGALDGKGYDVPKCHGFLDTEAGKAHLSRGCNVRRACPISQSYGRVEEQSAYHMSIFHKGAAT
ncbi:ferredoxin [uncultured Litoreibacter sp.]|uniref:ferredoxin n=1 Tax=uncultured Litoreibacter sp. TaxID=1392394 RepID=UPI002602F965|nr:ferredoxin [uncultured Litoreibacter sp.]